MSLELDAQAIPFTGSIANRTFRSWLDLDYRFEGPSRHLR